MYVCAGVRACLCVYVFVCVRACVRACLRACVLACLRACVRACVCVEGFGALEIHCCCCCCCDASCSFVVLWCKLRTVLSFVMSIVQVIFLHFSEKRNSTQQSTTKQPHSGIHDNEPPIALQRNKFTTIFPLCVRLFRST